MHGVNEMILQARSTEKGIISKKKTTLVKPVHLQYLSIPFISFSNVSFETQPDHGIDLREKIEQTQRTV